MELNRAIRTLAKNRTDLSSNPHERVTAPAPRSTESHSELLQKICSNLPDCEKERCKQFEEMFRQNSHSPEFASRAKRQATVIENTQILLERKRRNTSISFSLAGLQCLHETVFEVKIKELSKNEEMFSIFIGDNEAANDESQLLSRKIMGIITIGEENEPNKYSHISSGYFVVPKFEENFVWNAMKTAFKPLNSMLHRGNVMVHCNYGCVYSPVLVIAYLVKRFSIVYTQAKDMVMKDNPKVFISSKFDSELKQLERHTIIG
jgi:hypothetical protein